MLGRRQKNGNYITFGSIVYYNYYVEHYGILIKLRIYRPLQPTVILLRTLLETCTGMLTVTLLIVAKKRSGTKYVQKKGWN